VQRIATAAVLLLILWASIFLAPTWVFVLVASAAAAIACWECYRMLERSGDRPLKTVGILLGCAVVGAASERSVEFGPLVPLVLAILIVPALSMALRDKPKRMLATTRATLFPIAFVALPFSYLVAIHDVHERGRWLLVLLFVIVAVGDTMAFYVGSLLGRRRLAPEISPKKTWEGAVGGVSFAVAGSLAFAEWVVPSIPLIHAAVLGILLATAAIVGDLTESMVKRAVGVKDSSRLLPGHGGMLDRTDSLLFTGPILYYYYVYFLQGVW
jgi:phosphatidate cytidylyltransferase